MLAGARWYDPSATGSSPPDTAMDPVGRQYQYVQNRPGVYTDPSGNVPVLVLLAPGFIGSAVGLGATFVADVVRNAPTHGMNVFDFGWSSGGTYAGSVVGGFTGGMVGFYSKNPWLGGAAGGASGNTVQQVIDNRGFGSFDVGSLAVDTVLSTVASGVAREWIPRGPGRPATSLGSAYWGGLAQRYWKRAVLSNVLKRLMKVPFVQSPGSCAPVLQGDFYSFEERLDMGLAIAM